MRESGTICDLAQAEIDALTADGITLTPAEVVRINALAWAACGDADTRLLLARGVPVDVGGARLWPLTLCAAEWFSRVGAKMEPQELATRALAFAMAHGRSYSDCLAVSGDRAELEVRRWARRLNCTQAELVEAIALILDQDAEPDQATCDKKAERMTFAEVSAFLAVHGGGDPEMWERQCAIGYVSAFMQAVIAQNTESGKASFADPKIRAARALAVYCEEIRADRKKERAA